MDMTYLLLADAYVLIIAVFVMAYFVVRDIFRK